MRECHVWKLHWKKVPCLRKVRGKVSWNSNLSADSSYSVFKHQDYWGTWNERFVKQYKMQCHGPKLWSTAQIISSVPKQIEGHVFFKVLEPLHWQNGCRSTLRHDIGNLREICCTCNCFFEVLLPGGCILLVLMHLLQYHEPHKPGLISYHILSKRGNKHNLTSKNCEFREVRLPFISALIDSCAFSIIIHSRDWIVFFHTNCLSTKELQ
jgi:hypothetical protein